MLSWESGFHKMVLEGDSLQVVQTLNINGRNWSRYSHLIEEARKLLNCLQNWKVNHVR
jgi:hypothetical protein